MRHDGAVSAEQPTVVAEVREAPLSVDEALAAVNHPRAGGVALFVGTVREHDEGREGVAVLEYSAHPGAVEHLRRIAGAVAALDQVQGVYAVHRTGQLRVGDLAVVCAVAAEHRAEAFDGARRLIEELKAEVPIWKRQEWSEGDHSWVGL
ncbi:molybdopterin synthase [Ornithinimicrobium sp. CNJ-824]|nr:molybdenum cofactor biosynthesis protein MoaE [Ornithinimicrobium sp. CNJ-824]OLT19667.1 molybdopterin synthase [Ornithinimicrobium sp. CNJ-824]